MPALTNDEIRARIADGSIFAITVDTSIFDRYGANLGYPALRKLDQFKDGHVRVILSEVIEGEIVAHVRAAAIETQRALKTALKKHKLRWSLSDQASAIPEGFALAGNPAAEAQRQVDDFVAAVGAEIVSATAPDTVAPEVLRRYFAVEPPFETSEKKKHEFPDAFALLTLEARAEKEQKLILCVSADKGWRDYAESSERLVFMDDLDQALSLFNEADHAFAEELMQRLRAGTAPALLHDIETAIQARLDDFDWMIDAHSPLDVDFEPLSAALQYLDLDGAEPTVIAADGESVTFIVKLEALVSFEASFTYSVRDSIDRDYVNLGSEDEQVEKTISFEVAIVVNREQEDEPEAAEVEVAKHRFEVDFGYVEPFRNEDPSHEKY